MADNRNGSWRMRYNDDARADEPIDNDLYFDEEKEELQIPPRNILETDSAKYTAEFVKGVVKGLYTAGATTSDMDEGSSYQREPEYPDYRDEPRTPRRARRDYEEVSERPHSRPMPKIYPERPESEQFQERRVPEEYQERVVPPPEKKKPVRESVFEMSKDEVLEADGFLKAYEEKNRTEKPVFTKKSGRRTFSSLSAEESAGLENVLSGKPARRQSALPTPTSFPEDEEYVLVKQDSYQKGSRVYESPESEEELGFRKVSYPTGIEEKAGYKSVPAYEEVPLQQEKIPIIINRKVEGKPKKTADDYRTASKPEREKPVRSMDSLPPAGGGGANVIAALFMIAAVIIIGLLVWKINSLSKPGAQIDTEELTSLREQNNQLVKKNEEMETKYNELLNKYEALEMENRSLTEIPPEDTEPESEEPAPEAAPAADGLVDGYYTVQRGDTLWKISEKFLGSGEKYTEIARANNLDPSQSLYSGLKIKIPTQ